MLHLRPSIMADLTELEERLHAWLVESDFETVPWSTKKAAKAFKVDEEAILEAVANLTRKLPQRIQVSYADGSMHIAAE